MLTGLTNDNNDGNNDVIVEVIMSPPELQPSQKKRENTPMVWDHFTKCFGYSDDDPHAKFNYSDAVYACHPKRNENSTMRTHLEHYCKKNHFQLKDNKVDLTQIKLAFHNKDNDGKKVNYKIFTIENAQRLIAEMIIYDELLFLLERHIIAEMII